MVKDNRETSERIPERQSRGLKGVGLKGGSQEAKVCMERVRDPDQRNSSSSRSSIEEGIRGFEGALQRRLFVLSVCRRGTAAGQEYCAASQASVYGVEAEGKCLHYFRLGLSNCSYGVQYTLLEIRVLGAFLLFRAGRRADRDTIKGKLFGLGGQ